MSKSWVLALFAILASFAANAADVREHAGAYRGFAEVDNDDGAPGEIMIIVNQSTIMFRVALGPEIHEEELLADEFVEMSHNEIKAIVGFDEYDPGLRGLRHVEGGALVFRKNAGDSEWGLLVKSTDPKNLLPPTHLFSPEQISRGLFYKKLETLQKKWNNKIPTLP